MNLSYIFEKQLKREGQPVTIKHKTMSLDEFDEPIRDNNNKIIYTTTDYDTTALINFKNIIEKTDMGYTKSKSKTVMMKFKLDDAPYLSKKDKVIWLDSGTVMSFESTIEEIIPRKTHIEVRLS